MYKLYVALRYLRKSWLNYVAIIAVALAVMVPICVMSVMTGFDQEFRARLRDTLSDLIIEPWTDTTFADYEQLAARIARMPHVTSVSPEYSGLGIVMLGKETRYVQFRGVDLDREVRTTDFAHYYRAWRARLARNELEYLFPPDKDRLSTLDRDGLLGVLERLHADPTTPFEVDPSATADQLRPQAVRAIASNLRVSDFDALSKRLRSVLRAAASRYSVNLRDAFQAAEARVPAWTVDRKAELAPMFIGRELGAIARDPSGSIVYIGVGETITLVIPTDIDDTARVWRKGRIIGQFQTGMYEYDERTLVLPIESVQDRLRKPGRATSLNVRLDDFANAPKVRAALWGILTPDDLQEILTTLEGMLTGESRKALAEARPGLSELRRHGSDWVAQGNPALFAATYDVERILFEGLAQALARAATAKDRDRLAQIREFVRERQENGIGPRFRISTWEDKRRNYLRAVQVERKIQAVVLFFVTLISGFLILSILHTTVLVKTKDIGILKAVGGTVHGIMGLFLLSGTLIGIFGALLGSAGGLLITKNLPAIEEFLSAVFKFRLFPPDIYYLDHIPVDKDPLPSVIVISLIAVGISLMASALPAWKASRLDAVEALRYE